MTLEGRKLDFLVRKCYATLVMNISNFLFCVMRCLYMQWEEMARTVRKYLKDHRCILHRWKYENSKVAKKLFISVKYLVLI